MLREKPFVGEDRKTYKAKWAKGPDRAVHFRQPARVGVAPLPRKAFTDKARRLLTSDRRPSLTPQGRMRRASQRAAATGLATPRGDGPRPAKHPSERPGPRCRRPRVASPRSLPRPSSRPRAAPGPASGWGAGARSRGRARRGRRGGGG